jgi:L-alanine-DL-glutamate epimerase-like enolase superfamily enzyme
MSIVIDRFELRRLRLPLKTPYHLSFMEVEAFDTILVIARDRSGREGLGDATVLTGYTDETIDGAWDLACSLAPTLVARTAAEARSQAMRHSISAPFTATAFASAAEMLDAAPVLSPAADLRVPVLGTINETEIDGMGLQIEALLAKGYRTLKIKVGSNVKADIQRIRLALQVVAGRAGLRIDANQGYVPADAIAFAKAVPVEGVELFEQPCAAGDWDAHLEVARDCPLPLMLDESIYDEDDIDRAERLKAARFVKVKLMKFGTLQRLAGAIERIRSLGMEPVLGNGVASDVGCWMETCVAAGHIRNAGEMNGWLKMTRPLFANPLQVDRGAIHVPAGYRPVLDWDAVEAATTDWRAVR